jgi:hypothetical protein
MHVRTKLVVLAVAALALLAPTIAGATATYSDTISGYEYYATSTNGKFAGSASGSLPGKWNASVQHTPLCLSCGTTATITGGTFSLATTLNGGYTLITGRFVGGTVQVIDPGTGCKNQLFSVNGVLGNVGPWYSGSGSGSFTATLTHYRYPLFGNCITYGASVTGGISLTF